MLSASLGQDPAHQQIMAERCIRQKVSKVIDAHVAGEIDVDRGEYESRHVFGQVSVVLQSEQLLQGQAVVGCNHW